MMWLWISLAMAGPAERSHSALEAGRVAVDFERGSKNIPETCAPMR